MRIITITNIDPKLLEDQRSALNDIIFEEREACKDMTEEDRQSTEAKLECLEGIQNLLDWMSDELKREATA